MYGRIRNGCQHNSNFHKIIPCISVGLVVVSIACCILITAEFSKESARYNKDMYVFLYVLAAMIILCGVQMWVCACCYYSNGTYPLSVAPPFSPAYISRTPYSAVSSASGTKGYNISYYVDTTDTDTVEL
jgi:hypothetical protein